MTPPSRASREARVASPDTAVAAPRSSPYPDPSREGTPWAEVSDDEFHTYKWQAANRIETLDELAAAIELSADEREGFSRAAPRFRFAVTPYYALLAARRDPRCPIRQQIVPTLAETVVWPHERADPLGEEEREVAPNVIHRYPDRVLLLVTDRCPVYCRFCTRRRVVGRTERQAPRALLDESLDYVAARPEIREVILSGGDALVLSNAQLDHVLSRLRSMPHVEIVRIATRMPVTCPMRITDELVEVLRAHAPVYVLTHFNHPRECTTSAARAVSRLVDRGVVVYNQSVLLRGINDHADTIIDLNRRLVSMRASPYYLHQCDLAEGIEHFRTPLQVGVDIIDRMRGHVSGLMVPELCVDVPGGLGKVTVLPEWIVKREPGRVWLRTFTGAIAEYPDPVEPAPFVALRRNDGIDTRELGA